MFAIDNVTMTYGATDPCADGHTLTAVAEVPATCEETGVKAHWVCSVCGKLFSDAEGKNETTLEALTIPAGPRLWRGRLDLDRLRVRQGCLHLQP